MSDELLPYYNQERKFIYELGKAFAEEHPRIASRLRLGPEETKDPHVGRLIEAFAFLNARIRHKLDDDFPEVSESLLGVLYPHYLAPIPSLAIVQFVLDRHQGQLATGYSIPRGETIETEPIDGQPCRFRTCYDATLWPLDLRSAALHGPPFTPPPPAGLAAPPSGVLRLTLQTFADKLPVGQLLPQLKTRGLRLFLKGQAPFIHDLYELLLNDVLGVVVASSGEDRNPVLLNADAIRPVGFGPDEGLLEYPARSFWGYRLLTEYFAFSEKFLFLDLFLDSPRLTPQRAANFGQTMEVFCYLRRHARGLETLVNRDTFQLGCCPMVNLFQQRAEPISLSHTQTEYRVVPDARRPLAHEVYSVNRVTATSPQGEAVEFLPFFSVKHGEDSRQHQTYWHSSRRPGHGGGQHEDGGTEVFLTLVDLDFKPSAAAKWTLDVETTCLNRDLPRRLPFGGDQPRLQMVSAAPVAKVLCLTEPTPTLRPALRSGTVWRLISHLSLNHLSLADANAGAEALREILKLYEFKDSASNRAMIEGVQSIVSSRTVGRVASPVSAGFCRGLKVTLRLDEEKFSGGGVFLFASVLERFLGLYTSLNSFTQTTVLTTKREEPLHAWPPRAGEQVLL